MIMSNLKILFKIQHPLSFGHLGPAIIFFSLINGLILLAVPNLIWLHDVCSTWAVAGTVH